MKTPKVKKGSSHFFIVIVLLVERILLISCLIFLPFLSIAQFSELESFSSDILERRQVTSITQDAQGFLWLSDGEEIFRFNGHDFEQPISWSLEYLLIEQDDYLAGLSHYEGDWLFMHSQNRVMLFDLELQRPTLLELKDSTGMAYKCIDYQYLGEGDILLHCVKEQTEDFRTAVEKVLPDDQEMVFLRLKDRQLQEVTFPNRLLYNRHYQRLRLPWCTFDAQGNRYLFYNKRLMIWNKKGQLLEDFAIDSFCDKEDCQVLTRFDVDEQLIFTYGDHFYSVRELNKKTNSCNDSVQEVLKGNDRGIYFHCINSILEENSIYLSENNFLLNEEGNIWFYGRGQDFFYFNKENRSIKKVSDSEEKYSVFSNVFIEGIGHSVWIGGSGKISNIAPLKKLFDFQECTFPASVLSKGFRRMKEGPDGHMYALIADHVFKFDPESGKVNLLASKVGVQRDFLITEAGLWMSNGQFFDFAQNALLDVEGAHPRKDLNGSLYESRSEGELNLEYNRDSSIVSGTGPALYQVQKENFTEMLADNGEGDIWRANDSTLYQLEYSAGTPRWEIVQKLSYEITNKGWLTALHYGTKSGLLWLAFDSGKLLAYDKNSKEFIDFDVNNDQGELYVQDVKEMDENVLWISTSAALLKFSRLEGTTQRYVEEVTHLNEGNGSLVMAGDSSIWLERTSGVMRFDIAQETFYSYSEEDGLAYYMRNFCPTSNGKYYFTINNYDSRDGFVSFDPQSLVDDIQKKKEGPRLVLSSLEYADEVEEGMVKEYFFKEGKQIDLYHWNKAIRFEYHLIGLPTSSEVRYSYRLKGNHDVWDFPSTVNFARFVNLRSGTYDFQVKAQNGQGAWYPNQLSIPLVVHPPWWKTSIAYLVYSLLLAGLLYLGFSFFKKRLTLQAQLRQEQEEALRLKELDSFKSKLYTNLTHEFRTPLTVILGLVGKVREEPEKFLEEGTHVIERNSKNLLRIINQLLDLSKLEDHSFQLNLQQTEVISYLHYITESFHSYANGKNLSLRFHASDESLIMDYDPEQIKQVMTNLISNAIKFTPSGGEVFVRVLKVEEQLEIEVSDTGKGIPEEQIAFIFDRFYQVDGSTTREGEGTGIGLSHAKELVLLMGGQISVESIFGKGSKFLVTLPIRKEAPIVTESLIPKPPVLFEGQKEVPLIQGETSELPKLLIIEDNADVVLYLKSCLESHYQLDVAYNGAIGIQKAFEHIPDLIVSDVMMPGKDGFEVCNTLKNDERTSHIPIVLLTAKADLSSKLQGLDRGADAYLAKPFNQEELLIRLKRLFELRQRMSDFFAKQLLESTGFSKPIEVAESKKDLQIENEFLQKVNTILEEHIGDEYFGLPDLCQKIRMSRSQLFRKMKALTNTAPSAYIRKYRLQKAKYLLENSEMNVAEAAFEVGFKDPSYFSKIFQEEFGVLPSGL